MLNSLVPSAASGSAPCLSGVLGAFQPTEREWQMPAGTELENTLAESHFPGERDSAALSKLLWQQGGLSRVPGPLREALCFPTATRKAAAVVRQKSGGLDGNHTGLPAPTRGTGSSVLSREQSISRVLGKGLEASGSAGQTLRGQELL